LVVSAPGVGAATLTYMGEVYVFFGSAKGLSMTPDITIMAHKNYTNLGMSLQSGDANGDGYLDLIIGSPMSNATHNESGEVWIFFSSKDRISGQILNENHTDWSAKGHKNYEWFGFHTEVVAINQTRYLIVSSPSYSVQHVRVGRIYAYDLSYQEPTTKWIITGSFETDGFGELGSSFAVGKPVNHSYVLAMSLPTKNLPPSDWWSEELPQAGFVVMVPLLELSGPYVLSDLTLMTQITGDQELARMGYAIDFDDLDHDGYDDFWATEPYFSSGDFNNVDNGAFFIWKGGDSFPKGNVTEAQSSSDLCVIGSSAHSLFGKTAKILDFNGDEHTDLLLAGPRDSTTAPNGGYVSLLLSVLQ